MLVICKKIGWKARNFWMIPFKMLLPRLGVLGLSPPFILYCDYAAILWFMDMGQNFLWFMDMGKIFLWFMVLSVVPKILWFMDIYVWDVTILWFMDFDSRKLTFSVDVEKCIISHLDLENFPGVIPQTPIEAGLKLLAHQGPWEFSPKKHKELSWSWGGSWTFLLMGRVMNFSDFQWGGSWTSTMPTFDFSRPPGWCK